MREGRRKEKSERGERKREEAKRGRFVWISRQRKRFWGCEFIRQRKIMCCVCTCVCVRECVVCVPECEVSRGTPYRVAKRFCLRFARVWSLRTDFPSLRL